MAGQERWNAEHTVALGDLDSGPRSFALYWLEDVDFLGKSTWHGPITPVDGGLQTPPDVVESTALRELGTRGKRRGKLFVDRGANVERPRKSDRPAPRVKTDPTLASQRALAAQPAIKIAVERTGWYRVTQPELVAAGLNPATDPHTLQLFVEGSEQAITVTGAADGRFDAADAIEFYGSGLDTPPRPRARMAGGPAAPGAGQ